MRKIVLITLLGAVALGLFLSYGVETDTYECGGSTSYQISLYSVPLPEISPYSGHGGCTGGTRTYYRGFVMIRSGCESCRTDQGISYDLEPVQPDEITIVATNIIISFIPSALITLTIGYVRNIRQRKQKQLL